MRVHVEHLLRAALQEKPLGVSDLRRKLPDYAKTQADELKCQNLELDILWTIRDVTISKG